MNWTRRSQSLLRGHRLALGGSGSPSSSCPSTVGTRRATSSCPSLTLTSSSVVGVASASPSIMTWRIVRAVGGTQLRGGRRISSCPSWLSSYSSLAGVNPALQNNATILSSCDLTRINMGAGLHTWSFQNSAIRSKPSQYLALQNDGILCESQKKMMKMSARNNYTWRYRQDSATRSNPAQHCMLEGTDQPPVSQQKPHSKSMGNHNAMTTASYSQFRLNMADFPVTQWKLCSNNRGKHSSLNVRLYSISSHCRSNEKNNVVDSITDKTDAAASDRTKPNNLIGDISSQEESQQTEKVQSITQQQQKPSEPSIHNISYLPPYFRPYAHLARLDKPIGTFLLLHPCLWSTALASYPLGSSPDLTLCALFGLGSFIMRGAGCTINDMWDSQYDKNVERTKTRPLASGDLTYPQAWKFLALQLSAGLGVLLSLPHLEQCFVWGVASLPLVATYPLMKRYTNYPQLALGLTFNWGAIMGWVAVRGDVDWTVVGPLYASGVAWTLVYDTLYAHQDKKDDAKLGLKSTALTFGEGGTKPILAALAGVTWGGWMMAGYNCGFGDVLDAPYYYAGVSAAASHLLWQIYSADLNDPENLAYRFRSNNLIGWTVLGSCVAGNMMAVSC